MAPYQGKIVKPIVKPQRTSCRILSSQNKRATKTGQTSYQKRMCAREHRRLLLENQMYDILRSFLGFEPTVSKIEIIRNSVLYIKMLSYVVQKTLSSTHEFAVPLDNLQSMQDLTVREDFRAILPLEAQELSMETLLDRFPQLNKLFSTGPENSSCTTEAPATNPIVLEAATTEGSSNTQPLPPIIELFRNLPTMHKMLKITPGNADNNFQQLVFRVIDHTALDADVVTPTQTASDSICAAWHGSVTNAFHIGTVGD